MKTKNNEFILNLQYRNKAENIIKGLLGWNPKYKFICGNRLHKEEMQS